MSEVSELSLSGAGRLSTPPKTPPEMELLRFLAAESSPGTPWSWRGIEWEWALPSGGPADGSSMEAFLARGLIPNMLLNLLLAAVPETARLERVEWMER